MLIVFGGLPDGEDNLRLGRIVIADSVNPLQCTRDAWLLAARRASTEAVEVEFVCSDTALHRRRIETRMPDIEGLNPPVWREVIDREYQAWDRPHVTIDTAYRTIKETVRELLVQVGFPP